MPRQMRQYQSAELPKCACERGQAPVAKVGASEDAEPLHLARGDRADAVEARDRQRRDELRPLFRRDHAQAVGLALVGRELGDELAIADAGRRGEPGLLVDPAADVLGDARAVPSPSRSSVTSR